MSTIAGRVPALCLVGVLAGASASAEEPAPPRADAVRSAPRGERPRADPARRPPPALVLVPVGGLVFLPITVPTVPPRVRAARPAPPAAAPAAASAAPAEAAATRPAGGAPEGSR